LDKKNVSAQNPDHDSVSDISSMGHSMTSRIFPSQKTIFLLWVFIVIKITFAKGKIFRSAGAEE
jgi:hypothetical protein